MDKKVTFLEKKPKIQIVLIVLLFLLIFLLAIGELVFQREEDSKWIIADDTLKNVNVKHIGFDSEGTVWLGRFGAGIYNLDGENVIDGTSNFAIDGNNRFWVVEDGISIYDSEFKKIKNLPSTLGSIRHLAVDGQGQIWAGGVSSDESDEVINIYSEDSIIAGLELNGLTNTISSLAVDKDGIVWAITDYPYQIIQFASPKKWENETLNPPWSDIEDMVFDDQNRLWVAASNEIWMKTQNGEWKFFDCNKTTSFANDIIALAIDNENRLWAGKKEGVQHLDLEKYQIYNLLLYWSSARMIGMYVIIGLVLMIIVINSQKILKLPVVRNFKTYLVSNFKTIIIALILGGIASLPYIFRYWGIGSWWDFLEAIGIALPGALFTCALTLIGQFIGNRFNKAQHGANIGMGIGVVIIFLMSTYLSLLSI